MKRVILTFFYIGIFSFCFTGYAQINHNDLNKNISNPNSKLLKEISSSFQSNITSVLTEYSKTELDSEAENNNEIIAIRTLVKNNKIKELSDRFFSTWYKNFKGEYEDLYKSGSGSENQELENLIKQNDFILINVNNKNLKMKMLFMALLTDNLDADDIKSIGDDFYKFTDFLNSKTGKEMRQITVDFRQTLNN